MPSATIHTAQQRGHGQLKRRRVEGFASSSHPPIPHSSVEHDGNASATPANSKAPVAQGEKQGSEDAERWSSDEASDDVDELEELQREQKRLEKLKESQAKSGAEQATRKDSLKDHSPIASYNSDVLFRRVRPSPSAGSVVAFQPPLQYNLEKSIVHKEFMTKYFK